MERVCLRHDCGHMEHIQQISHDLMPNALSTKKSVNGNQEAYFYFIYY